MREFLKHVRNYYHFGDTTFPFPEYPPLSSEHVAGAKLFANRKDMICGLPIGEGGVIAEVGVMRGDFSVFMMDKLRPKKFVAFDIFAAHEVPKIWGVPSAKFFDNLTQLAYFRKKTAPYGDVVVIKKGRSSETMLKYADRSFDLVYIDAGHGYFDVKTDAACAAKMVKDSGIVIFNDYIMFDHLVKCHYGIIPVVNDLVVNQGWHVIGFALEQKMYCDIAIQKK